MTGPENAADGQAEAPRAPLARRVFVGCFTAWLGLFSGAMVFAFLSKMVAYLTHTQACSGVPACNWYIYAMVGGALGAVSLPVLVIRAMSKPAKRPQSD